MLRHRDDVPWTALEHGDLRGERPRLGAAAGARDFGLSRYRVPPGRRPLPPHAHMVAFRGPGVIARVERLDPRDGEE